MPAIAASPRRNDEADHRKVDRFQASRSRRRKLRDSARGNFEFVRRIATAWEKEFATRLAHGHFPTTIICPAFRIDYRLEKPNQRRSSLRPFPPKGRFA